MSKGCLRLLLGACWGAVALAIFLPVWLLEPAVFPSPGGEEPTLPIDREIHAPIPKDRGRVVRLLEEDGSVRELTMEDYLWRVVAAEMPARFEPEALKAQACAARTYTLRLQQGGEKHGNANVCTLSACCQAYTTPEEAMAKWGDQGEEYREKIARAVAETDALGILYEGEPIQALYFSSSPGYTTDAVAVWGNGVDYLRPVSSPEGEEVPNYRTRVELTVGEVREKLMGAYPACDLTGDPEGWFTHFVRGEGGAVTSAWVGGVTLTGNQVRTALGLRSPAFTLSREGERFIFEVTGYGHGVGMSQYGANKMAREGQDFRAILEWYYTGAQVEELW